MLRDQERIVEYLDLTKQQKFSQEIIYTLEIFYCDEQFSRQLPEKKDYVSVQENKHVLKRLLLCCI